MLSRSLFLSAVMALSVHAESGYDAWLRYAPIENRQSIPAVIASIGDSKLIESARQEAIRGVRGMLGGTLRAETSLPKEDAIEVTGRVVEKFKAGMFSIELEAGRAVLATMAGKLRRNRIKIMNGDRVTLELSPYDLTKGRITYRHK